MHGKQLALSFVSPLRSIMQSSQVSCSTNLHHLMARERNGVGKAPETSPGGLFWLSHLFRDSIVMMLLLESLFLNISFFSHLSLSSSKKTNLKISVFITMFFIWRFAKCFQQNAKHGCLAFFFPTGLKHQTQTSVHSTIVLTLHTYLSRRHPCSLPW